MFLTLCVCKKLKTKFKQYPELKMNARGINFFSHSRHRIKIGDAKFMQVGGNIYLKHNNRQIEIRNVDNIFIKNDFLYFTAKGKCEICFKNQLLNKYFNIKINSNMIDVETLRKRALINVMDNLFDLTKCEDLIKYLKLIRDILKIKITNKSVEIKQNQFKIPFCISYKLNNTIKVVNVNQNT